jgi:hypothetical protein
LIQWWSSVMAGVVAVRGIAVADMVSLLGKDRIILTNWGKVLTS